MDLVLQWGTLTILTTYTILYQTYIDPSERAGSYNHSALHEVAVRNFLATLIACTGVICTGIFMIFTDRTPNIGSQLGLFEDQLFCNCFHHQESLDLEASGMLCCSAKDK
jgi:hypothetical protein